jgi:antitoxin component of RelBE/YafQ-DinJ toxin-antitoxin module
MKIVKVIAGIDEDLKRRLYHVLLDEGITFSDWMRDQVDAYLKKKEGKKKAKR